jgi:hypothetical protein
VEFLSISSLEILNQGNEPTFCNGYRLGVIDIILGSIGLLENIEGWGVSHEPSLSDHRHILFALCGSLPVCQARNPRGTDLGSFRAILYERSKRRVCNASQNALQRRPNFQMGKYIKTRVPIYTNASDAFQVGVSPALGISNAAGGVANASVRNAVQSTLGVLFSVWSVAFVHDVRC